MSEPILAKAFAESCCHDQADFLNKASRQMYGICKGQGGYEGQQWEIVKHLDKDGIAMIMGLAKFIELKSKDIS